LQRFQEWIQATGWRWLLTSALVGYLIFHPLVMILAHLMVRTKSDHGAAVSEIIFSGLQKSFSIEMMPWGVAFAIIIAITGVFIGRNLQISAQLRESEKRYRQLSITDDLTGLYNSRHFFKQLEAEIERTNRYGHPLSLLMIDLDDFKQYNDTYGHIAGDRFLENVGKILRKSLRKTDSAYRYGGEEFAVILPESAGEEALHFADRIRQAFESLASSAQPGQGMGVTVSIGVAQYINREDITPFIKRADKSMYTAKNSGKNRIFYRPEYENS
jgi:diguanylate cyclase (GGDEF)-like protein